MASKHTVTEELFLKDIAKHELSILRDDGLYRHLRCKMPNTGNMAFDLISWPGHLCYAGDMGTYVFSRIPDMFQFFRDGNLSGPLRINPGYWAEKCEALDRDGIKQFSADIFREQILDYLNDIEVSAELRQAVEDEVLAYADDGEYAARSAAHGFRGREHCAQDLEFTDFFERDCTQWTVRYLWCCYALVWAIRQYDAAKNASLTAIAS